METISAADAKAYFVAKGYSNLQASAIVGGLETESGSGGNLNLGAYNPNDPGGSTGIAQWSPSRWAAENQYATSIGADPYSSDAELGFVNQELTGSESSAGAALSAATTPEDATAAFLDYERPAGWSASNPFGAATYGQRLGNTVQLEGVSDGDAEENQALSMDNGSIDPNTGQYTLENVSTDHSGTGEDNPTVITIKPTQNGSTTSNSSSGSNVSTGGAVGGSIAQAIASAGNAISKTIGTSEQAAQTAATNAVTTEAASFFDTLKDYFGRFVFIALGLMLVAGAIYLFTKDKIPMPKVIPV